MSDDAKAQPATPGKKGEAEQEKPGCLKNFLTWLIACELVGLSLGGWWVSQSAKNAPVGTEFSLRGLVVGAVGGLAAGVFLGIKNVLAKK
ncbi:MAG TPA: hypothetical protein VKX17_24995 [Planctomycetota bacterium]|nr:hypothetical protein [Planctomycetota bacterium]